MVKLTVVVSAVGVADRSNSYSIALTSMVSAEASAVVVPASALVVESSSPQTALRGLRQGL